MGTAIKYTIADYNQMIADGVFEGEPRPHVELIEGEIQEMSPIGPSHEYIVDRLNRWSVRVTEGRKVLVRIQNSVELPSLESVPQPDILWVADADYSVDRPTDVKVLLLIEVAVSSLAFDCGKKAALYAKAGIKDYWVVDVKGKRIVVFRESDGVEYTSRLVCEGSQILRPLAFTNIKLRVSDIFP